MLVISFRSAEQLVAATSLWFAGEKMDMLFVRCKEKWYKRKLKTTGIRSEQKAVVPKPQ
ncbi:MAG: hypothetical protein ABJB86_23665 [Bacteroidota bacterium]